MAESWLERGIITPASQSIFIRVLLDKKYALPFRVIDALVFHFVRSLNDTREYPVLWHQSFLTFAQRYAAGPEPHHTRAVLCLFPYCLIEMYTAFTLTPRSCSIVAMSLACSF
jgi:hypothetical protein